LRSQKRARQKAAPTRFEGDLSPRIGGAGTEGTEHTGQAVTRRHGDTKPSTNGRRDTSLSHEQPSAPPCLRVKRLFRALRSLRSQEMARGRKQTTISLEGRPLPQGSAAPGRRERSTRDKP